MKEDAPNYHITRAWRNRWRHICSHNADLLTIAPLKSHRKPQKPTCNPPRRSTFPSICLLSIWTHWHIYNWADTVLELLVALSARDKGGQREIKTWRLHKQSPCSCLDCINNSQILEQGKTNSKESITCSTNIDWSPVTETRSTYKDLIWRKEALSRSRDSHDNWSVSGAGGTFLAFLWCVSCASECVVNELQPWPVRNSPGVQNTCKGL